MVGVDGICRERPYRIMILLEIASRLEIVLEIALVSVDGICASIAY